MHLLLLLVLQLRRRCMTERRALQALAAAKRGASEASGALGRPPAAMEGPPVSVGSMRLCVPLVPRRFSAARKVVRLNLQPCPLHCVTGEAAAAATATAGAAVAAPAAAGAAAATASPFLSVCLSCRLFCSNLSCCCKSPWRRSFLRFTSSSLRNGERFFRMTLTWGLP